MDLKGHISADEEDLSSIHLLNINSKKGVTTNKNKHFVIPVTLSDTLIFFDTIQKKLVIIDKYIVKSKYQYC